MFSNEVDGAVVSNLETVLREKYGFSGSLANMKFSKKTEKAFPQLIEALTQHAALTEHPTSAALDLSLGPSGEDGTPQIGDSAYVFWCGYGWFTATIENWLPDQLSYMIKWTDGDWAAELASYTNLCVDRVPDPATIGVGTKVLFKQGLFYCGLHEDGSVCDSTGRTLTEDKKQEIAGLGQISDRWHMGRITSVTENDQGKTVYNGSHVQGGDAQLSIQDYVGYNSSFQGLRLSQLRTLPNVYNCVDSSPSDPISAGSNSVLCDVFVSKVPSDDSQIQRITGKIKNKFRVSESCGGTSSDVIQQTVQQIKSCSVYLVCLSDSFIEDSQAMSELLYAKKTLGKTVIPVVIGRSGKWMHTTAGMLLAGQLYIQFSSDDVYDEKVCELQSNLEKLVISDLGGADSVTPDIKSGPPPRVFLSYCWSNSKSSFEAGQLKSYVGHDFSDPRRIKADIEERIGERVWLDIEQLDSVNDSGMFGQIAEGLKDSTIVVMCVSKEYTCSQNCQMEASFALRSLHKEAIVLEVGSGKDADRTAWVGSSVGMVLPTEQEPYILTADQTNSQDSYDEIIDQICGKLKERALSEPIEDKAETREGKAENSFTESKSLLRASIPMVGDSVIAQYAAWQFFPAKVASFNKAVMMYTVDWEDPDPSCRVQPYTLVAMNNMATDDLIGIGSSILFKQGVYQYGESTGDIWNLGEITDVVVENGVRYYSGKHSKTAEDGLVVATWPSFRPTFERAECHDLRLFPNAMEMLQAYKNL